MFESRVVPVMVHIIDPHYLTVLLRNNDPILPDVQTAVALTFIPQDPPGSPRTDFLRAPAAPEGGHTDVLCLAAPVWRDVVYSAHPSNI